MLDQLNRFGGNILRNDVWIVMWWLDREVYWSRRSFLKFYFFTIRLKKSTDLLISRNSQEALVSFFENDLTKWFDFQPWSIAWLSLAASYSAVIGWYIFAKAKLIYILVLPRSVSDLSISHKWWWLALSERKKNKYIRDKDSKLVYIVGINVMG